MSHKFWQNLFSICGEFKEFDLFKMFWDTIYNLKAA